MDGEVERMPPHLFPFFHSLSCPSGGHPRNVIFLAVQLQVMEITNVPGADSGSIPRTSLVVVIVPYCCSGSHHLEQTQNSRVRCQAFETGSTDREWSGHSVASNCVAFGTADGIPRELWAQQLNRAVSKMEAK